MSNYIKSPLNYTGNKYRILSQIQQYFPRRIHCMIDLFCGGATVGLNVDADKIIFIDNIIIIKSTIKTNKENKNER